MEHSTDNAGHLWRGAQLVTARWQTAFVRGARGLWVAASAGAAGLLLGVTVGGVPAAGAQSSSGTFRPSGPLDIAATADDGTAAVIDVQIQLAELTDSAEPLSSTPPPPGELYFEVVLSAKATTGSPSFSPFGPPPDTAVVLSAAGTSLTASHDDASALGLSGAAYYFAVPPGIAAATLTIGPCTVTAQERPTPQSTAVPREATLRLEASSLGFTLEPPAATTTTAVAPGTPVRVTIPSHTTTGTLLGSPTAKAAVGAGGGGLLVLVFVVPLVRRRRFYRADDEGRLLFVAPPVPESQDERAEEAAPEPAAPRPGRIVVRLLGKLLFDGVGEDPVPGPVQELVTFLVLHPGERFTSAELRASIWVLGRQETTKETFRQYVRQLRRRLGPGVVVTKGITYELTDAVSSDWGAFQRHAAEPDAIRGRAQALGLVRGPVLFGAFDGKKNGPFTWAAPFAHDISRVIEAIALEQAADATEAGEHGLAHDAVRHGLLCAPRNMALRRADLRLGLAIGGPPEVAARLEVARAALRAYPEDVAAIEDEARHLGCEVG